MSVLARIWLPGNRWLCWARSVPAQPQLPDCTQHLAFGFEAMPWASMLPKHLYFSILCLFFQEPAGSFVALGQGFGAASSIVQACLFTREGELHPEWR